MNTFYEILTDSWLVVEAMAPYILFGFAVAGVLSVVLTERWMQKHLGGNGIKSVIKASLFGVPLPLCSCGVIPVAASLKKSGASKGAVTSFLISTPQTGVDSIAVTYALLGPVFAIFRPVAAFVMGVIGGGLVSAVEPGEKTSAQQAPQEASCECCHKDTHGRFPAWWKRALKHGFIALPQDFALEMLIGILISGLLTSLIPPGMFEEKVSSNFLQILIMMGLGIPFYICSTASVPMAFGLLAGGVTPGAVLAFLITGPATNAATITTMNKVLGTKSTLVYLGTIAAGAIICGLLMDGLLKTAAEQTAKMHHEMDQSTPVGIICGIILLAILLYGVWEKYKPSKKQCQHEHHDKECH